MEKISCISNMHNCAYNGRQPFLPPRSPVPGVDPLAIPTFTPRNELRHHHRTSSECGIVEEQPSWVDDLLNEPETHLRRGTHRRSSSDSFVYLDIPTNSSDLHMPASQEYNRSLMPRPSWGSQESDRCKGTHYAHYNGNLPQNRGWERYSGANGCPSPNNVSFRSKNSRKNMGSLRSTSEADCTKTSGAKKQNQDVSSSQMTGCTPEMNADTQSNNSQPDVEQKRIKQHLAQRSRVRKLQYIAELERNVKALQAKGSEASAELQFLDQHNIILGMENETLRQRLDSLSQEHLLKQFQQKMLEREIARLRSFLLQQQQQLPAYSHGRRNSRDLDSQFANLSLKRKEAKSARDTVPAPLSI